MSKWKDVAIIMLRNLIGDDVEPYLFEDERLTSILTTAGYVNIQDIDFQNNYSIDLVTGDVSPDPIGDSPFIYLMALKAAAILAGSTYKTETHKGLSFKDGPSTIDGRSIVEARQLQAKQAAKDFEDAKFRYQVGDHSVGEAIMTPFRTGQGQGYMTTNFF